MTKNKNLSKNIFLVVFSTLLMVLSIFSIIINTKARKFAFDCVRADTTTINFYGSNVYVPTESQYYGGSNTWETIDWNLSDSPYNFNGGRYLWSYNNKLYYSSSGINYVFDTTNKIWSSVVFGGYSIINGTNIWTDGVNYYFSQSSTQKKLSIVNNILDWSNFSWYGLSDFSGSQIWTDGVNYYYSNNSTQYVLDVSTHTWSVMTWSGLSSFQGVYIWTDGVNYYYSYNNNHYVLDVSTHTWSVMTWSGISNFSGNYIYHFDNKIFYGQINQYVLDVSTHTWEHYYYNNFNNIDGIDTFVFDNVLYYMNKNVFMYYNPYGSSGGQPTTQTAQMNFDSVKFEMVDNNDGTFSVYQKSMFINNFDGQLSFSYSDKFVAYNSDVSQISTSDFVDYLTFSFNSSNYYEYYIPYYFNGTYYYSQVEIAFNGLSSLNINKVLMSGNSIDRIVGNNTYTRFLNSIQYYDTFTTAINNHYIYFRFRTPEFDANTTIVDYFGDTLSFLDYYSQPTAQKMLFCLKTRQYYLADSSSSEYQQGFQTGQESGYQQGYQVGYSAGSDAVSQSQYNAGYSAGYSSGVANANNYSFFGLISSVVDAPISYIRSLFNFNLLGIDMYSFITAMFTIAVIIVIVKKVI